ncbi:hypothetical protein EJB05_46332, partial [Eragrostis curvula]
MEPAATSAFVLIVLVALAVGACASVNKTIESDDGEVIDCVDFYQQPAFKNAPAGSGEIQAKPAKSMKDMVAAANATTRQERLQTWRRHGSCPAGTVPIRRASPSHANLIAELFRRSSPFGRPGNDISAAHQFGDGRRSPGSKFNSSAMAAPPGAKVEVAAAYATNGPYLGARADVPYWKLNVHPDEFSMHYIMVGNTLNTSYKPIKGAKPPEDLTNQIVVGLVNDGGVKNNCFNLDCGGFHLKEGAPYALESSWRDSDSQVGGVRYGITLGIHREPAGLNWWVSVMDQEIGYFPETVFNTRFPDAVYVEMGGRVLDTRPGGNHTTTPMGSGMPACAGSRFAASIMEYLGVASDGTLFNDPADRTVATTPSCYDAKPQWFGKKPVGYSVAYGGPGGIYCDHPET